MGYLLNKYVKSKERRELILMILDIILIIIFIWFALNCRHEWEAGYNYCKQIACRICANMTHIVPVPVEI